MRKIMGWIQGPGLGGGNFGVSGAVLTKRPHTPEFWKKCLHHDAHA